MVDFEYWINGVVGTCELIASEEVFRKVWVEGDHTITSIHYYDELYVQVYDDLFFDENLREFASIIADEATVSALARFSQSLKTLDEIVEASPEFNDPAALLSSPAWAVFRESARLVIALPYCQQYLGRLGSTPST